MTILGLQDSISFITSSVLSASTEAVCISAFGSSFLISSHLLLVLLAKTILPKTSAFCTHLYTTTLLTPPAPIINVVFIKNSPKK